tara:strand:- start:937 stop:1122 length:186 start_codon:yes stop_codon:yes gene_type:complete
MAKGIKHCYVRPYKIFGEILNEYFCEEAGRQIVMVYLDKPYNGKLTAEVDKADVLSLDVVN